MKIRRVMLAAPKSGSGKTMLTCALLQTLKDRGEQVISYKCGPDYIDPMFHKKVIDIPSKNLDTFFTNEEQTKRLFLSGRTEREIAVLEGVMGLYDGLSGKKVLPIIWQRLRIHRLFWWSMQKVWESLYWR